MSGTSLRLEIESLSDRERADLATVLELNVESSSEQICERIRWMYWSRTRAKLTSAIGHARTILKSERNRDGPTSRMEDQSHPVPDWEVLVMGLARHLKVFDPKVRAEVNELYISHALIVRALDAMSADQRRAFFDREADFDPVLKHGTPPDERLAGPARSVTALGLANAAGFTLYTASSTALGFVTHAVGISLPFAAFTGLSSTIAFLIGPAGWLTVSAYAFWKVTSTNWGRLTPAIVYIINARAAR